MFTPILYSLLHKFTEISHTQRVPYSVQLLHIQDRLYVFGHLRKKKMDAIPPTPHPASFTVFAQIFLNFIPVLGWGDISKFSETKGRKFVISEKLILTIDFYGEGHRDS